MFVEIAMEQNKLVSVITAAFNSSFFIGDTIKSVQAQTYKEWELLIVDDHSDDSTTQIVEQFEKSDNRIRLIRHQQNAGPATSRNTGIGAAKGRYIAFLDSDDLWLPDKLKHQIDFMQKHECVLSFTGYKKIDENGNPLSAMLDVPDRIDYQKLLLTNVIGNLTAMYDVGKLEKVYLPVVPHEDYALWLKILKKGHEAYGLNECLALYRVRANSVSRNKLRAASYQWRVYREIEKLPLHKSIICFFRYAYWGYIRFKK